MKLSEILSKPFKVKGGGTVNLKGLSKHIVDKEVGGDYELPIASAETLGGIKVGENLSINPETGVLSASGGALPIASAETLGGVKVGDGLEITGNGVLVAGVLYVDGSFTLSSPYFSPEDSDFLSHAINLYYNKRFRVVLTEEGSGYKSDVISVFFDSDTYNFVFYNFENNQLCTASVSIE